MPQEVEIEVELLDLLQVEVEVLCEIFIGNEPPYDVEYGGQTFLT